MADWKHVSSRLLGLFSWHPPKLYQLEDPDFYSICPPLAMVPRAYYDQHIDDALTLKTWEKVPSAQLASVADRGIHLPNPGLLPSAVFGTIDRHTTAVDAKPKEGRYLPLEENSVLEFPNDEESGEITVSDTVWSLVEDDIKSDLKESVAHFPCLATWQILAVSPESDLLPQDLGRVGLSSRFLHKKPGTVNFLVRSVSNSPPPDAITPWTISLHEDVSSDSVATGGVISGQRRSEGLRGSHTKPIAPGKTLATKRPEAKSVIPSAFRRPKTTGNNGTATAESLSQLASSDLANNCKNAWCRAVRGDMTIMDPPKRTKRRRVGEKTNDPREHEPDLALPLGLDGGSAYPSIPDKMCLQGSLITAGATGVAHTAILETITTDESVIAIGHRGAGTFRAGSILRRFSTNSHAVPPLEEEQQF
ncbi:hypothetical protein B0H17DRAFT_1130653 [Mycena rosella]|uniref:Uncharacterized protein n=1 Tax=Mycena rosella TaxID=1033263 RepID=A0AAD7GJ09_MYCRO|nr:hypothetical protein B0H17DRAFT_1130653 [Mycena rosella]